MLASASRGGGLVPGGCLLRGVSGPGGSASGGGLLRGERVSAPRWVCLGGVSALRGSRPGGGVVSQHALRQTPSSPCGQNHRRL